MSETNSTAPALSGKPNKPYPDFPLFPHATKRWAKKICGKLHYFGPWDDPDGALAKYLEQKDDLHAGRTPRPDTRAGVTVKDACNAFLTGKKAKLENGELGERMWQDYKEACDVIVSGFGKSRLLADLRPEDFAGLRAKLAKRWGPVRLGNAVQRIRSVFKHALDAGLIDRPVLIGPNFGRPSAKVLRLHRAKQGPKLFSADEVRRILAAADVQLRAMALLGINGGFGIADCGRLPMAAMDLGNAFIDFPRPKTGIPRRCPLWPETVAAIREALANRPTPKDDADASLVFLTRQGTSWVKDGTSSPVCFKVGKLLKSLGINGRKRLGFYTLRHTFRTVADESKDQPAVDFIMGHEAPHMSAVYRETISDARLKAVADHVRTWLFPSTAFVKTADLASEPAIRQE
jgi:integrase